MIRIGDRLPDFTLPNQEGKMIDAKDFSGKKLVVFFYPKASTPTCTTEVCNLRDSYDELSAGGFTLIGISTDSVRRQQNFSVKYELPFDILADENHAVSEAFGVWQEKKNYGRTYMGVVRATFMFDEKGICNRVITNVKAREAASQILSE